ncbi:hypothetical protein F5Y16DRAFT_423530 [Xylariaceae sp. FL0255]|nr:hypothetical protein F5Y16DRAFT_423530 [Xylariaceae sp. FL0255]
MPRLPCKKIATSKMFTILLGPDKKPFTIHADLLAAQSKPLNALVNGNMKEAAEGIAEWPEIEEETFARFWEFAYTGTYHADEPSPTPTKPELNAPTPSPTAGGLFSTQPGSGFFSTQPAGSLFSTPMTSGLASTSPAPSVFSPQPTFGASGGLHFGKLKYGSSFPSRIPSKLDESSDPTIFVNHLLSHAKVYVFADYYDIGDLMLISLRNMHAPLNKPLSVLRQEAIIALADYTYKNTVSKGGADRLRELVATYVADYIKPIWKVPEFQVVMEKHNELRKEVMQKLVERMP